jgi:peptide/nickel transport system permease protein
MTDERPALQPEIAEVTAIARGAEAPETPDESLVTLGLEAEGAGQWQLAWRRLRRHRLAMASLVVLVIIAALTIAAGLIAPRGFAEQQLSRQLLSPRRAYLFGTDTLGRDEFARVLYGGRISLLVGLGVALISAVIGTAVGAVAGYYGGRIDSFLMRLTDLFLSIPLLVILIIAATILGGSVLDIVAVLSLFFWMPLARIVRGQFLSLKEKEFVEAARSVGASNTRIIVRHLLPNTLGVIIVNVTLEVAAAILTESVLSFLGFGIQPPTPTWGNMLAESRDLATVAPWLVWFPGLAILLTVLCVNFLGDGLRDAFDPTQQLLRR